MWLVELAMGVPHGSGFCCGIPEPVCLLAGRNSPVSRITDSLSVLGATTLTALTEGMVGVVSPVGVANSRGWFSHLARIGAGTVLVSADRLTSLPRPSNRNR